jgi:transcriptional regulator with XRE-family HTH domain
MDKGSFDQQLAQRIENWRKDRGLSRKALSELATIPYATLHRKLEGIGSFSVDELNRVSNALEVAHHTLWPEVNA